MQRTWSGPVSTSCLGEAGPATLVAPCSMMAGAPLHRSAAFMHAQAHTRLCPSCACMRSFPCSSGLLTPVQHSAQHHAQASPPLPAQLQPVCVCLGAYSQGPACRYHLFYQSLPDSADWSFGMTWGHAVSQDLVTWTHQPPALQPSPGSRDADGCFTGSALAVEGQGPVILYTGAPSHCRAAHLAGTFWDRRCTAMPPLPCLQQVAAHSLRSLEASSRCVRTTAGAKGWARSSQHLASVHSLRHAYLQDEPRPVRLMAMAAPCLSSAPCPGFGVPCPRSGSSFRAVVQGSGTAACRCAAAQQQGSRPAPRQRG